MDPYLALFFIAALFGCLVLQVIKPCGVRVNQLHRVKTSPLVNFVRVLFITIYSMFIIMLFVGMALRRHA